jgi:hypothetical protein
MMNVRRTKTALLWLLLLTSTATFALPDGHFSDKDQESPTTEGNSGYSDDSQDNPTTENGNSGHSDDEEENPSANTQTIRGDVNHDGSVTMADANMVVNYFLATDKPDGFDTTAADVNEDGDITMADANMVVNMFLSGEK